MPAQSESIQIEAISLQLRLTLAPSSARSSISSTASTPRSISLSLYLSIYDSTFAASLYALLISRSLHDQPGQAKLRTKNKQNKTQQKSQKY